MMQQSELKAIEQWQEEKNISIAVLEGIKTTNNWKKGKRVSENEFETACQTFLKAPIREEVKG